MSNKSGIASQVIPLPSGGGALQGIGETFAPDLFTGTGNLTVPIALPPGRNGFQPELSLATAPATATARSASAGRSACPASPARPSHGCAALPRRLDAGERTLRALRRRGPGAGGRGVAG